MSEISISGPHLLGTLYTFQDVTTHLACASECHVGGCHPQPVERRPPELDSCVHLRHTALAQVAFCRDDLPFPTPGSTVIRPQHL